VVTTEVDQLEQQQVLQSQAVEVQQDLHLPQRLSVVGAPVRVGSAAPGVMVRRDLDFTVICADLGTAVQEAVAGLGAGLSLHPRVRQVQLRNDTPPPSGVPRTPPKLRWKVTPAAAGNKNEHDPLKGEPVGDPGTPTRTPSHRRWWDQWFEQCPEPVVDQSPRRGTDPRRHDPRRSTTLAPTSESDTPRSSETRS